MALKPCRDCGTEVSAGAWRCPKCGRWRPTTSRKGIGWALVILGVLIVITASQQWLRERPWEGSQDDPIARVMCENFRTLDELENEMSGRPEPVPMIFLGVAMGIGGVYVIVRGE